MLIEKVLAIDPQTQKLINLQSRLTLLQPLGEKAPSPELAKLRSAVLDVHSDVEETLETLVSKKLFVTANPYRQAIKKTYPEFEKTVRNKLFKGSNFPKKMLIVYDLGLIDENTFKDIDCLNNTRNDLAHPSNMKYLLYESQDRQIWVYELLCRILETLAKEDAFFGF